MRRFLEWLCFRFGHKWDDDPEYQLTCSRCKLHLHDSP